MRDYERAAEKEAAFRQEDERKIERRLIRRHLAGEPSIVSFIRKGTRSDIAPPVPADLLPDRDRCSTSSFDPGKRRAGVAAVLREVRPTSMVELIRLMDRVPSVVLQDLERDEAEAAAGKLSRAGAKVVVEAG